MASDYVTRVHPAPDEINHGDAVHYDPEKEVTDAGLGYTGTEPDSLNGRLQFTEPLVGPQGEKGDTGDTGPKGDQGDAGPAGADGADGVADESADYDWTGSHTFEDISYSDTYWDDLKVPVSSVKVRAAANPPDWDAFSGGNLQLLWFDQAQMEQVFFTVQMPHAWKEGTDLHAHVHWTPNASGLAGQTVQWGLEYSWSNIGVTFPGTTIITGSTPFPNEQLVANRHYLTDLGDISGTGKTLSSMLICRLFRDATNDTLPDDAGLLEFDFHYEIDSPGSRQEYVQ